MGRGAEIVASGEIGSLASVQCWFSYFNDDPTNIRNILEVGGGALYDIGCYCGESLADALRRGAATRVGGAGARPGDGSRRRSRAAILAFDDGIATFTCSTRAEDDQRVAHLRDDGPHLDRDPVQYPARPADARFTSRAGGDPPVAPDTRVLTFEVADPYTVEAERFAAAVLEGSRRRCRRSDAVANLRVIERIFAAAEREPGALTLDAWSSGA